MTDLNSHQFAEQWSGPPRGQLVMGVQEGHHGNWTSPAAGGGEHSPFETDGHGFVREHIRVLQKNAAPMPVQPSADHDAGNRSVHELYRTHGGGRAEDESVRSHWDSQPLVHIRSDTVVHTGQSYDTTENKTVPGKGAGRKRINAIRSDLQAGGTIREPVWVAKQSGRLFAMDGHHRVVAAREQGQEHYPARLWDLDKKG